MRRLPLWRAALQSFLSVAAGSSVVLALVLLRDVRAWAVAGSLLLAAAGVTEWNIRTRQRYVREDLDKWLEGLWSR